MIGVRKPFEQDDYDAFDTPAKDAMAKHLSNQGHRVHVPPENYGADLESTLQGIKMYHEVEVSRLWKLGDHPFPTGSIPERKIRLKKLCHNEPLFFWMLRLDYLRTLCFSSVWLLPQFLVEVPNYKVQSGEYFYRIPKQHGKEFDLIL